VLGVVVFDPLRCALTIEFSVFLYPSSRCFQSFFWIGLVSGNVVAFRAKSLGLMLAIWMAGSVSHSWFFH
jgi:hypothetical protein